MFCCVTNFRVTILKLIYASFYQAVVFIAECDFISWIDQNLLIHSLLDGHLSSVWPVSKAVANICV